MTRVLVAPDKFKGSLTAHEVAQGVRRGILECRPMAEVRCVPVADGGEGTLDAAVAAGFEEVPVTATGPTGEPVRTGYAVKGDTAVVEMADVSGLSRLPGGAPAPLTASSRGTGELLAAALDSGARAVVLGIGGSACTDGGAGMLQALGASLRDTSGNELPGGGGALEQLAELDLSGLHPALRTAQIVVACDVDNPLTGEDGAAAVYGPQKGATGADVARLDANLTRLADHVARQTGADHRDAAGAGAAGGVGFAAISLLGAQLRPGIELLLELLDFESHVREAELVVVGEGSLDSQSLRGKAPVGVARLARAAGVEVVAVCGRNELDADQLQGVGIDAAYSCLDLEPDPERSLSDAAALLERLGRQIAEERLP